MKKSLCLLFFFSFMFFLPNVKAVCNYQEDSRVKQLASNVFISYDYHNDTNTFSIVLTNLHPDIYIYDTVKRQFYYYNGSSNMTIDGYKPGENVKFNIHSNLSNCQGQVKYFQYISLPFYNQYYLDPLCEGLDEYSLCQKWTTHGIKKYEDFVKEVTAYKLSLENSTVEEPVIVPTITKTTTFIDFLLNYYYYILIIIIIGCLSGMYYLTKKDRFNF